MDLDSVLHTAFDMMPVAMGVRSLADGDVIHVYDNDAAAAMYGYPASELRGKTSRDLGYDETKMPMLIELMEDAARTGRPCRAEGTYQLPCGPRRIRKWYAVIPGKFDDEGRPLFLGVAEDITELRDLQKGLERADRLATLGTLTTAVGHEVAGPLLALTLSLDMATRIVDDLGVGEPGLALAPQLRAAGEACEQLTEVLKTVHEFGRGSWEGRVVGLSDAVHRATTLAGAAIRQTVDVEVTEEADVSVLGRLVPIAQIILNLIMNGARAAGEAHPGGGARVEIRIGREGDLGIIEVRDNGPGIAEEVRDRLFEPFVTGHAGEGGTGLGLYTARRLAESMSGRLSLSSTASGTVGRLEIPTAPP